MLSQESLLSTLLSFPQLSPQVSIKLTRVFLLIYILSVETAVTFFKIVVVLQIWITLHRLREFHHFLYF